MTKTKIGIAGCLGRMGKELLKAVNNNPNLQFSGGFEIKSNPNIGKSIGTILDLDISELLTDNPHDVFKASQVIIDFTTPESTEKNLLIASDLKTPMVIGTTGLTRKTKDLIKEVSLSIPLVQSYNMSIGVNLLLNLVEDAAKKLNEDEYDAEIFEIHHKHKIDAPSGTAISLGEAVARGRSVNFDDKKIFDRTNNKLARKTGDIGFAVLRAGEIQGEHTVNFLGNHDQLSLSHKTSNRSIFVNGAIKAAEWIISKKSGIYSMKDVLGI